MCVATKMRSAFTLVEVLAVILVIGILSAAVVYLVVDTHSQLNAEADMLKNYIRYAQSWSMKNTNSIGWGISVTKQDYTLFVGGTKVEVNLPDETSPTHPFPGPVTAEAAENVFFNGYGAPVDKKTGAPLATDIFIILTDGTASTTITVHQVTGFIE